MRQALIDDYKTNNRKSRLDLTLLDEHFADHRASHITTGEIKKFSAKVQAKGRANGTINRQLSHLQRMFRLAMIDERLAAMPHIPKLKEAPARQGFVEPQEFETLLVRLPTCRWSRAWPTPECASRRF
jgi:site-specific recombinase XerD